MSSGNNNGFVRVMRSHQYNQFEICLPIPPADASTSLGVGVVEMADAVRKNAARLVDKAVREYDRRMACEKLLEKLQGDSYMQRLNKLFDEAKAVTAENRTPEQIAVLARFEQIEWLKTHGEYDYEDDAPDFDGPDPADPAF